MCLSAPGLFSLSHSVLLLVNSSVIACPRKQLLILYLHCFVSQEVLEDCDCTEIIKSMSQVYKQQPVQRWCMTEMVWGRGTWDGEWAETGEVGDASVVQMWSRNFLSLAWNMPTSPQACLVLLAYASFAEECLSATCLFKLIKSAVCCPSVPLQQQQDHCWLVTEPSWYICHQAEANF